jgi:membrane associated rhomboid family serine protease
MIGPSLSVLVQMGTVSTTYITEIGEWSRLVTGMVLHAGVIHFLIKMSALLIIGPVIEHTRTGSYPNDVPFYPNIASFFGYIYPNVTFG